MSAARLPRHVPSRGGSHRHRPGHWGRPRQAGSRIRPRITAARADRHRPGQGRRRCEPCEQQQCASRRADKDHRREIDRQRIAGSHQPESGRRVEQHDRHDGEALAPKRTGPARRRASGPARRTSRSSKTFDQRIDMQRFKPDRRNQRTEEAAGKSPAPARRRVERCRQQPERQRHLDIVVVDGERLEKPITGRQAMKAASMAMGPASGTSGGRSARRR